MLDMNLVLKDVLSMRKDVQANKFIIKDQYKNKYKYLSEHSPTLFELVFKDELYLEHLNMMISNVNKIKRAELTQEDADKDIGAKMADKYVYPVIDMDKELKGE